MQALTHDCSSLWLKAEYVVIHLSSLLPFEEQMHLATHIIFQHFQVLPEKLASISFVSEIWQGPTYTSPLEATESKAMVWTSGWALASVPFLGLTQNGWVINLSSQILLEEGKNWTAQPEFQLLQEPLKRLASLLSVSECCWGLAYPDTWVQQRIKMAVWTCTKVWEAHKSLGQVEDESFFLHKVNLGRLGEVTGFGFVLLCFVFF